MLVNAIAVLWFQLAAQVPAEVVSSAAALSTYGLYGIIAVLMGVIKHLWSELKEERQARLADRTKHDAEKQMLNDKVLNVSRETTTAVLQNTQVQRQLVSAIRYEQEDE